MPTSKTTRKRSTAGGSSRGGSRKTSARSGRSGGASSPSNPSPGISRIDQESRRTHGYFVRVGYKMTDGGSRPTASAYFGDASHGGRKKAWEAAEAWLRKNRKSSR
ncbi:MAG TPA: hypothetical protein VHM30_03910 [Gemmatimonadaceae bacterium]|nr:hypothetical protein [Gemmatimonadaceae bacterium]